MNFIYKTLEKLLLNHIIHHLETNNPLPAEQHCFTRGHYTQDQILLFIQHARDAQNKYPTNHTVANLLDLTAFDKVWKNRLSSYMRDFLLIGRHFCVNYDFLRNRRFKVKYNRTLSGNFYSKPGSSRALF
ncbi:putative RNA-directed DNA polymerase from transposon BS [Caerostris extrusa]|uniref:RNA-directed DNA polymerase from transposon BS n=1 Tax=Caerostris extrusa TaxID=172846 RepID=A0AAV4PCE7_CAEEX|nr:putative RNA-directed DNA polymerase from transposon BS [Caerostris extrusa]